MMMDLDTRVSRLAASRDHSHTVSREAPTTATERPQDTGGMSRAGIAYPWGLEAVSKN